MKTLRTAVTAAAVAALAALSGCGTPVAGTPAPQPGAAPGPSSAPNLTAVDPAADRQAVETVFRDYYGALLARDFAKACTFNAPETTQRMLATLLESGITAATCEEGFTAVYAIPGTPETVERIAKGAEVKSVDVSGDAAGITWSAEVRQGDRRTVTSQLRRIDGQWRLVSTGT
jgi:hypothetical protein